MTIKTRLGNLRALFDLHKIHGYIVPSTDEYMSEYTAPYAKRLEYITGFTGSNGMAVILRDKVLFFTDGRYLSQAARQLDSNSEIYNLNEMTQHLKKETLGYDPMLFTEAALVTLGDAQLKPIKLNLIDQIWEDQPSHPATEVYQYEEKYAGEESDSKLDRLRKEMRDKGAEYCLLTLADSICWLLNIRASDIDFCPLMLGYCVVGLEDVSLFTNQATSLQNTTWHNASELPTFLESLKDKCIVDKNSCPAGLLSYLTNPLPSKDPCQSMKSRKHKSEILGSINAHIKDAVALCETLAWLMESLAKSDNLTEYDIGLKLTEFRARQEGYVMDSFPAIVGYRDNGAIIHYKADKATAKAIEGSGLLLIDSGGHYLGGTTDITRTIALGTPSDEQREHYTDVLKGHIALARQRFPKDTTGQALDTLARMHLWQKGLDYAHGTGHGVGNFLSVHEGPQRLSQYTSEAVPLQEGMIVSNEPGYYVVGEYGIRIENLVYVQGSGGFLCFKNLTLVPYCKDLIDEGKLSEDEKLYLKTYNASFMEKVYPRLSDRAKTWALK